MQRTKLTVNGMCCAEEVKIVQKALQQINGIVEVRPNLVERTVTIGYDPSLVSVDNLITTLGRLGMKASPYDNPKATVMPRNWNLLLTFFSGASLLTGLILHWTGQQQVFERIVFVVAILTGGGYIAPKAWRALTHLSPDMNLLMCIATLGALGIGAWDEAATVIFLFSLAELLESFSLAKARQAIQKLMILAPETAWVGQEGRFEELPIAQAPPGSIILIKPGGRVPLDGIVLKGHSSVDQSPITGESIPVAKAENDLVYAGSINGVGSLEVRVSKPYSETTLAKIIHLVEEAQSQRAPSQRFVDRFAAFYTPLVLVLAAALAIVPPVLFQQNWIVWFYRSLVMLVIACPCALVISTPVAIISALTAAARGGVLIKGGAALESLGKLQVVCLDKTGTITQGRPEVREVLPLAGSDARSVLSLACALESHSEHPIAQTILAYGKSQNIAHPTVESFQSLPGKGVSGKFNGLACFLGNHKLVEEMTACSLEIEAKFTEIENRGQTAVALGYQPLDSRPGSIIGIIAVGDEIRPNARQTIEQLVNQGIKRIILLTGDNKATANSISHKLGIREVHAELMPGEKADIVKQIISKGTAVAMIGDGINDAPSLATATVGIAMGLAGTDIALETADVALMADDLGKLPGIISLGRLTERVIRQNIVFALIEKVFFLGLASIGWATLWMAIAADMGASLLVIFNGLRLLNSQGPKHL